jgi:hypothetical protein
MITLEFLEDNSIPEPNTGCWLWLRGVSGGKYKYPVWGQGEQRQQVSHMALECVGMQVPFGMDACHRCDVPLCVNPDHLFIGTRKLNMMDAQQKKRLTGYGVRDLCKQGHPLSGDNVGTDSMTGKRYCKTCKRKWGKDHYDRSEKRRNRWRNQRSETESTSS